MTTLTPRSPYSTEELEKLYPKGLQLQLVQVLLRHGERAPVSARFQNAGLAAYWPYCNAAQRMRSVAMTPYDTVSWDALHWRRRLERFGEDDGPVIASGPEGEVDGICQLGELTDPGRQSTYALGQRLRHLYVNQLKFMPSLIADADMIYLRATPLPRALESVQQTFWGMYPLTSRTAAFPPVTIVTRTPADETLFPNDGNCRRFAQLSRAFAQRTADRWNDTDDMEYLSSLISKWMPASSKKVAVDSHPRLSGIMDTINATLAHGPETRLPEEFYDTRGRKIIDKVAVEEWFSGYNESKEYRTVGIGGLVGDVVERMVSVVEGAGLSIREIGGENGRLGQGRGGESSIRFAMSGCHDTTLAAVLTSMGAFKGEDWPPYTSHIAVELFHKVDEGRAPPRDQRKVQDPPVLGYGPPTSPKTQTQTQTKSQTDISPVPTKQPGWFASMRGLRPSTTSSSSSPSPEPTPSPSDSEPEAQSPPSLRPGADAEGIARRPYTSLSSSEQEILKGYYVRLRYNDKIMTVPACRAPGRHLEGDETLCTLEAFKRVADSFTPKNWKGQCGENIGSEVTGLQPGTQEWAGSVEEGF